ncbi:hypothetical protein GCM10010335_68110 [Streptomyces galbus]|nr:hypothetical protein GCM10010335_68110 [Streptomyces galbus]
MWRRALRLKTDSDMSHALLDPGDIGQDGEWALHVYKGWSGEMPDRYPSFRAYMKAMYRGFHADRAAPRLRQRHHADPGRARRPGRPAGSAGTARGGPASP